MGTIIRLGRDEQHAYVSEPSSGVIEVPRHHIQVQKPAGLGNKVVVARGDLMGKLGTVKSKKLKFGGKWQVKEHLTDELFLIDPKDLAVVDDLPSVH